MRHCNHGALIRQAVPVLRLKKWYDNLVQTRTLGRTGWTVSEIGFGAWGIGGAGGAAGYGPTDDGEARRAIRRALDLGCNFFDTADIYGSGHSEELLGEVLSASRKSVLIATKVGGDFYHAGSVHANFDPSYIQAALKKSLRRLRTDYIDLYQLHNPPLAVIKEGRVFETMERLQTGGQIRAWGVSIFEPIEGIEAIRRGKPAALQVVFNLLSWQPIHELFPLAQEEKVGIIAREPLHSGFLTGKYQEDPRFAASDLRSGWPREYIGTVTRQAARLGFLRRSDRTLTQAALKFVLTSEAVSVTIPGCKTVAQVEENMKASECPDLTQVELDRVAETVFGPRRAGRLDDETASAR